ncbi:hypothetical protein Tco_1405140 [Tanacetum coccineum]
MAILESCPKHNMVAYLEKTDANAEFHEIIDFLARSFIHNALTVSPVVSTTFVEQFWMSTKSKIINNVRHITVKVSGKPVSISEASIRSDLLFDDADEIDSLPNQAIFDAIQLMSSKSTSWDQIPTNIATAVTDQAKQIKHLKAQIKKLKKQAKPVIAHHKAWVKSMSLKQRLAGNKSLKKQWMQKESVSKQGRKPAKAEPLVHKDPAFDELVDDTLDYMETEDAQDVGRKRNVVNEEKETADDELVLKMNLNKEKLKEKEKGVELKDVEETERPRPTSTRSLLTLKPLPKIDPKDKGKKKIEEEDESDTESKGIPEAEKKFKQLARDEEMARKVQKDWEAEEEMKREQFTVEEREKFLHDTIAAQRWFLAEQRAVAIRNRPPTRTQLRNQMMTYLKHVGNKKHLDLKNKTFEEIQVLYEKVKRFDESFTAVGSTEDERKIKEMNEGAKDPKQKSLKKRVIEETSKKDDITEVPAKQDVAEQDTKKRKGGHIKMLARKNPRQQLDVDSDDEHRKCLKTVTFEGTIDIEVMETKSVIARLDKVSSPDGDYLVIYRANGNFRAFNCLLEGDLKIMMESSQEENDQSDFWDAQQDWEIVTWRLYEACGVYILELKDGTVIHMLVERKYPLSKDLLQRMLDLGLDWKLKEKVLLP